jgi:hypothetical protein
MIFRRQLYETLSDLGGDVLNAIVVDTVMPETVELRLPLDIRISENGEDLAGELPLFRNRTYFDPEPAVFEIVLARSAT